MEAARRVDGQVPVDEVLVPFTLQDWQRRGKRGKDMKRQKKKKTPQHYQKVLFVENGAT